MGTRLQPGWLLRAPPLHLRWGVCRDEALRIQQVPGTDEIYSKSSVFLLPLLLLLLLLLPFMLLLSFKDFVVAAAAALMALVLLLPLSLLLLL